MRLTANTSPAAPGATLTRCGGQHKPQGCCDRLEVHGLDSKSARRLRIRTRLPSTTTVSWICKTLKRVKPLSLRCVALARAHQVAVDHHGLGDVVVGVHELRARQHRLRLACRVRGQPVGTAPQ